MLQEAIARVGDWDAFLDDAVQHGMAPLVHWHLRDKEVSCPAPVRRALASCFLHQRSLARVQQDSLLEIVSRLEGKGVPATVLKGGVLAPLLYPDPALRPMEDLDILVPAGLADDARRLLDEMGFFAPAPTTRYQRLQHQHPTATKHVNGHVVQVEIHVALLNRILAPKARDAALRHPVGRFRLDGVEMRCLHPHQMLWMQYMGLRKLAEPLRYIQLSDLHRLVEHFGGTVDWQALRVQSPQLLAGLEALDALIPFSAATRSAAGLVPPSAALRDLGEDYRGWPRDRQGGKARRSTMSETLLRTLIPSEWWGHLVYGVSPGPGSRWRVALRHQAWLIAQGARRLHLGPAEPGRFFRPRRM